MGAARERGAPVLAILGPTAVGKSRLALRLAPLVGGEIVSADSAMVYRGMNVGTDKPTPADMARVPHHLVDVVDPDEPFNVSDFQRLAGRAVEDILARGRLPLLVGGTGLWIRALLEGYSLPAVPPDPVLRRELAAEAERVGPEALHARLARLDPKAAAAIGPRNARRLIRALEVCLATGLPFSLVGRRAQPPPYDALKVGLVRPRDELYRLIDERVEGQLARGLVEEVRGLLARGYDPRLQAFQALGYKEVIAYLHGACSYSEMVRVLKRNTRRYAKRQLTWLRREHHLQWIDLSVEGEEGAVRRICALLAERPWPFRCGLPPSP